MLLHLVIAAALLAPGTSVTVAAGTAAAMVCSIAAEMHAPRPHDIRTFGDAERTAGVSPALHAPSGHQDKLTTQLRR